MDLTGSCKKVKSHDIYYFIGCSCFLLRMVITAIFAAFIYSSPFFKNPNGEFAYSFIIIFAILNGIYSLLSAGLDMYKVYFYAQISDKTIGATYMTLLHTVSNIGIIIKSTKCLKFYWYPKNFLITTIKVSIGQWLLHFIYWNILPWKIVLSICIQIQQIHGRMKLYQFSISLLITLVHLIFKKRWKFFEFGYLIFILFIEYKIIHL